MIQSNQPTTIEYYSYRGKNNAVHRKYTSEIDTTNDTQLIITGKHKTTREMASSLEYTPTKGTRPITNYTYTISIPYQKINKVASDQLKSYLRYMKVPGE